jgi:hypothetical protein
VDKTAFVLKRAVKTPRAGRRRGELNNSGGAGRPFHPAAMTHAKPQYQSPRRSFAWRNADEKAAFGLPCRAKK